MKLLLAGAFNFPIAQGSQHFASEQARALAEAGADVRLLTYGRGDGRRVEPLVHERIPAWLSPRRVRAGFAWSKPLADAALAARLRGSVRRHGIDAVLAHNVEATLAAAAGLVGMDVPIVHVAHTLFEHELASYLPPGLAPSAVAFGRRLDAAAARVASATLALSRHAADRLRPAAHGPVTWIPPGHRPRPAPTPESVARACKDADVPGGGYVVYSGNLDAYQDLVLLDAAAARLPRIPFVVATHDATGPPLRHLRRVIAREAERARALVYGARLAVLPRRAPGGFPIKLLGYLEAGLAVVGYSACVETLEHDRSAWLLPGHAGPGAFADAVARCFADATLRRRLGAGAQTALRRHHAWPVLARRTLELARRRRDSRDSG